MRLTAYEVASRDRCVAAMFRVARLLAGALLAEDGDSFLRYTYDAEALMEEWVFTDDQRTWAHDEAARLVPHS